MRLLKFDLKVCYSESVRISPDNGTAGATPMSPIATKLAWPPDSLRPQHPVGGDVDGIDGS